MKKHIYHSAGESDFVKVFETLCSTKSAWQAWSDFVEASAIAISNTVTPDGKKKQDREKYYMEIMKRYKPKEKEIFPKLLSIVVDELETNPNQDFLGQLFMSMELGNHWKGQFFTPYCLCQMMSRVSDEHLKSEIDEHGWISVNDCACGAGATLIGMRNQLDRNGFDWSTQAFFVAQDIDRTAALMCYIQLSLLGCAGYVVVADSLVHPICGSILNPAFTEAHDVWILPTTMISPVWGYRKLCDKADRAGEKIVKSPKETPPMEAPAAEPVFENEQMTLF